MTARNGDFSELLDTLFDSVPVREKKEPEIKSAFTVSLDDFFTGTDTAPIANGEAAADIHEAGESGSNFSLQACSLYDFMRRVVIDHFGMGLDYAFTGWNGEPLKAWWTVAEAIEMAEGQGFRLTAEKLTVYLDKLIQRKYIEVRDGLYRRCAFWDKEMDRWLLKTSRMA